MSFASPASSYDRFMGRYSTQLAPVFADFARLEPGSRALDVGCGPGALAAELARRLGPGAVSAIDPAPHFVEACRARVPAADVRQGPAETLPWADAHFDAALAQLVVAFMRDAPAGVGEMRRVTRPGGTVAAAMWAPGEALQMVHVLSEAVRALDPSAPDIDASVRYRSEADLRGLAAAAGLAGIETALVQVETEYTGFDDFWLPLLDGAGPLPDFFRSLDDTRRDAVRDECARRLDRPTGPFRLSASAWLVRGTV